MQAGSNLSIRYTAVRNFSQFLRAEEYPVREVAFVAEECTQAHGDAIEYLFQHADRRVELAGFNLRNTRIGHAGLASELPLRDATLHAQVAQALADRFIHVVDPSCLQTSVYLSKHFTPLLHYKSTA